MYKILFLIFSINISSILYASTVSSAIDSMKTSIDNLKGLYNQQNSYIDKIVNLDKQNLLEDQYHIFHLKQYNELINNAWQIEAEKYFNLY